MAEFVFGDMICYREDPTGHDGPIMYVGPCNHTGWLPGNIDILLIPEGEIDCKDPTAWRKCTHLTADDSDRIIDSFSRADDVKVWVGGKMVPSDDLVFRAVEGLDGGTFQTIDISTGIDFAAGEDTTVVFEWRKP